MDMRGQFDLLLLNWFVVICSMDAVLDALTKLLHLRTFTLFFFFD